MFTLKLYRNGPLAPKGQTVVIETVGLQVGHLDGDVKYIRAYKKKVGVMDEDGPHEFYVGGKLKDPQPENTSIYVGAGGNYYDWGVLENAQGKTTEMFR